MKSFKCKMLGNPKPQCRCCATAKGKGKVQMINASKANSQSFKKAFKDALNHANKNDLFSFNQTNTNSKNPIKITILFYFPRPKHHCEWNTQGNMLTLSKQSPTYVTRAPGLDNCLKLLLDTLQDVCHSNGIAVAHIESAKLHDPTQKVCQQGQQLDGCKLLKVSETNEQHHCTDCTCCSYKCSHKNKA